MSEKGAGFRVTFVLFGCGRPVPRQRIGIILITVIGFCRWVCGCEFQPRSNFSPPRRRIPPVPLRPPTRCLPSCTSALLANTSNILTLPDGEPRREQSTFPARSRPTDRSSFFRACKRWFDLTPGRYRSQLHRH
jgi:hypothetical protein